MLSRRLALSSPIRPRQAGQNTAATSPYRWSAIPTRAAPSALPPLHSTTQALHRAYPTPRASAPGDSGETALLTVPVLKDGGSSFGPTVAVEVTPIENWLELEAGVAPLFTRHSTEW
jgi:hypothetical protein